MFGLPKEAAGAIFAALIAGLISLLGLIISKEQKISEFRRAGHYASRSYTRSYVRGPAIEGHVAGS
jgi:hypothetical protein